MGRVAGFEPTASTSRWCSSRLSYNAHLLFWSAPEARGALARAPVARLRALGTYGISPGGSIDHRQIAPRRTPRNP